MNSIPEDFLRLAGSFSRDFADIRSLADRIAARVDPYDPSSVDEAIIEAVKFVETRCAQGGNSAVFQTPQSDPVRDPLSNAMVHLVCKKIEDKRTRLENQ
jgi:hypothetical protein